MKRLILVLISFFLLAFIGGTPDDLQMKRLRGRVKSIKESWYKMTKRDGTFIEDTLICVGLCNYDSLGNQTEEKLYECTTGCAIDNTCKLAYDNRNNIIRMERFGRGYRSRIIKYSHDSGDCTADEGIDGHMVYKYSYDSASNRIEEDDYSPNSNSQYVNKMKYDKKGNMIASSRISSDGKITDSMTCKYDGTGNAIERKYYWFDVCTIYQYKYDKRGNIIQLYSNIGGRLQLETKRQFDSCGNVIEDKHYDKNKCDSKERYSYEYEFDKHGNYVKQIIYSKGKPTSVIERQIEYY